MAGMEDGVAADSNNTLVERTNDLGSRIRVSLDFLCNHSTSLPEVVVQLFSHGLLSQRESEIVENKKSNYDSFRQLFTFIIPRLGHGDNSQHFVNVFQQTLNEHILKELNSAVVTTNFDPSWADTSLESIRFNVREPVSSFVGRENFLRDLHEQILQSHRTAADISTTSTIISRICVVTGLGGIGKTETIRKYIHSYDRRYHHVVWIDAEEHKTAENLFKRLAMQELDLSLKDKDNKVKDFDVLLKEIYDRLCKSNTLIVLDNAETLYDSDPQRPGAAHFLPMSLSPTLIKPVVLITSRHQDWPDLHSTPLPLFTAQESSAFLFRQLKLKESDVNVNDAETLSKIFGGAPLALQAAAAVILQESKWNHLMGKNDYKIQHLLSDYSQEKREVLNNHPQGSPDTLPLMFLWKVSLGKMRQQPHGHLANQILNVMAHLSPTNIPKELLFFISSNEEKSLREAVKLLVDYSFVHNNHKYFSIHRMLQDVILAHLEASTEKHSKNWFMNLRIWTFLTSRRRSSSTAPLTRITTGMNKYWPMVSESSEAYDAVHDNLVHVTMSHVLPKAENPSETNLHFVEFLEFVLEEIQETRWVEAEECCRVLITYFTNSDIPTDSGSPSRSPSFKKLQHLRRKLARILERMGKRKEAVDICNEVLSSFNSLEDQEDVMPEILDTKHRLASILDSQGKYEEAIKLYSSVLDLRSKLHGPTHKFTLTTKYNLSTALQKSGRLSEAKTLYTEVLEVEMKDHGPLHPPTLDTKHNMANILADEGRYDEALAMLREVVEARERELGPHHASTLMSNNFMASILGKQGKDEDALRIYAHVISSYEKTSSASHPDCLIVKSNMAVILGKQGKLDESEKMFCYVLNTQERLLGPSHLDTLTAKHNVAWLLSKQGKDAEALKLFEEVLELRTKQLGPTHPDTLRTNHQIGCLHLKMGDYEKAERIAKEVLAARKATFPSDHPDYSE